MRTRAVHRPSLSLQHDVQAQILEARAGLGEQGRPHSVLERETPGEFFYENSPKR
jgi:hypothetical protein